MIKAGSQSDARFFEQVRAAPFIFTGRVLKTNASTIPELPPDTRLAIVRVETVFRSPPVLGLSKGKRVTVQLTATRLMKVGDAALFYATPWLYGESIAVVEFSREQVPKDTKSFLERVARAELWNEDDKLATRLASSQLVLSGKVDGTTSVEAAERGFRSEHDPLWWRAEIAIDHVEKGKLREPRYPAYFPASLDEYWLDVPKLRPGMRGIFLLHGEREQKQARFRPPGLALLDPLDFQPLSHVDRVRALLKLTPK